MDDLTYLQALKFMRERGVLSSKDYYSLDLITRQHASTISYLASLTQIETVLNHAYSVIEKGGTVADFQKLVEKEGIELSQAQLDNVFRTNIQTAYAHGTWLHQQANKDKRPYIKYSAIQDIRVRPSHLALNGIIRHIDDPFWLTHYPPNGYRCFLPDVKIEGASLGAIKGFYTGKIVKLVTESGRKLSVTANHPILTSRGWVFADAIKNGDNLIAYDRPIESITVDDSSREIDSNQHISTAENLFKSFVGHATTISETSSFKFDDDVVTIDGEVNINVTDSGLSINLDTATKQLLSKDGFISRCKLRGLECMNCGCSSDLRATKSNAILSQYPTDIANRCIGLNGNLSLADILMFIEVHNKVLKFNISVFGGIPCSRTLSSNTIRGLFDGLPLYRFGLALSSQDDAMLNEISCNGSATDFGLFSYLIDTHSKSVFIDKVVNVIYDEFSGHVYDFQSVDGLLSANGIITHNCRCTTIAMTAKSAEREGITPDDQMPNVEPDKGFAFNPSIYTDDPKRYLQSRLENATNLVNKAALEKQIVKTGVEQDAIKLIEKSLSDVDAKQLKQLDAIADQVVDKDIRPSDIRIVAELAKDEKTALDDLVKASVLQKDMDDTVGQSVWSKIKGAFGRMSKYFKNTTDKLTGNTIKGIDALEIKVGSVIGIQTPTLFKQAKKSGKQIIILDAKGVALDLNKINGLNGALLAPDLNLKVVSDADNILTLKTTDQQATRYFVANQTLFTMY